MVTYLVDANTTLSGICWENGRKGLGRKESKHVGLPRCVPLGRSSNFNSGGLQCPISTSVILKLLTYTKSLGSAETPA